MGSKTYIAMHRLHPVIILCSILQPTLLISCRSVENVMSRLDG